MLYSCSPVSGQPTVVAGRPGRTAGGMSRFAVDLHCHVYVPEAAELVGDAFEMEMDDLFKFANEATRDVNAKQAAAINEQLISVERRIAASGRPRDRRPAPAPAEYEALAPQCGRSGDRPCDLGRPFAAAREEHRPRDGRDIPQQPGDRTDRPGRRGRTCGDRGGKAVLRPEDCLLYTSPSPRDRTRSRMPSSA